MINIAVIIPYFQKESGILRRALDSILKQQLPPDIYVEIIIIDDESPVPAITETDGLEFPPPFHHTIIKQRNGGVATARNTGLAHVSEGTTYIAFLDSDDIWTPEHLGRAITGLNLGYDYYFCDSQRIGEKQTTFAQSQFGKFLTPENKLLAGESLYKVNKEDFFDFSLIEWVSLIPTVVYRHAIAPKLTFRTSLRVAGEDCLFLLQLIKKSSAICYSSESLVTIADGVNIHASYSWDDPGHFMRYMCQILAFYEFRKHLSLSAKNDYIIAGQLKGIKRLFAFHTVRYFLKTREAWPEELVIMIRTDSRFWLWYPLYVLYVMACYPIGLYSPVTKCGGENWWKPPSD